MSEIKNLANMLHGLQEMVNIDNPANDPLVEAYNKGVDAMRNQVEHYINEMFGVKVGDH